MCRLGGKLGAVVQASVQLLRRGLTAVFSWKVRRSKHFSLLSGELVRRASSLVVLMTV